jgi:hypothetical protein
MVETTAQLNASNGSNESDSPEVIRARIQETRAHMSEVVDAIQDRLSPERLTQEAKEIVKDATVRKVERITNMATHKAENWRSQVVETVRQNPIPAAMIGIGLGWLLFGGNRSTESGYDSPERHYDMPSNRVKYYSQQKPFLAKAQDTLSENMSNVQEKAGEMTQNVQDTFSQTAGNIQTKAGEMANNLQAKAGEMASKAGEVTSNLQAKAGEMASKAGEVTSDLQTKVGEQADYLSQQTQQQMRRAKQGFQTTLEENPLAIGAAAVVAGAAIGLMLPITQKEDELMGETRDRLLHQAQDAAKETLKKVEHRAGEAYRVATEGETSNTGDEEETPSYSSFSTR